MTQAIMKMNSKTEVAKKKNGQQHALLDEYEYYFDCLQALAVEKP